jgi:adenylosuccinate lyase
MHKRYTCKEMAQLWSEDYKFKTWYGIEAQVCIANEKAGVIPSGTGNLIYNLQSTCLSGNYLELIAEIEETTKHDIIAFLTHLSNVIGASSKYIHYGMTSQDLIDTELAITIDKSIDLIKVRLEALLLKLERIAINHRDTYCVGRSHGIHAEPMTFGLKMLTHYAAFKRCLDTLNQDKDKMVRLKCSGAVGTYSMIDPSVEQALTRAYGIKAEDISTQVVPRERLAVLFANLSIIAGCIERLATEIRHLQRTEVAEVAEGFSKGQKGSSAMPHKKNPILTENLTGIARLVRMALTPAMEDITLWHERDISHSSVERVILPDTFVHLSFALDRLTSVMTNLVVDKERMLENLNSTGGLVYSQQALLHLVKVQGFAREKAYEIVQSAAHSDMPFKEALQKTLSLDEINTIFNPEIYLKHLSYIFNRVISYK